MQLLRQNLLWFPVSPQPKMACRVVKGPNSHQNTQAFACSFPGFLRNKHTHICSMWALGKLCSPLEVISWSALLKQGPINLDDMSYSYYLEPAIWHAHCHAAKASAVSELGQRCAKTKSVSLCLVCKAPGIVQGLRTAQQEPQPCSPGLAC